MNDLDGRGLAPLPGDPGEVRRLAAGLRGEADLLGALARTLRGLGDPALGTWASPAGEAFGRRAAAVPSVVERVAHRYGVADSALRRLADVLEDVQAQVAAAQRLHEQEWGPFLRAGDQMGVAEASADPVLRAQAGRHRAEMVRHGEGVRLAEQRWAAAHEQWRAADRACAAVLHGLLDDGLADSRLYDALTGTGRVAGDVSQTLSTAAWLPPLRPLASGAEVADGVGLAARVAVRVGYGDGDLASIVLSGAASAAGTAGPVLKAGARATNGPRIAATGTRTARRDLRVTAADRLRVGLGETLPGARYGLVGRRGVGVAAPPKVRPSPPWSRPPRSAAALRPWLREQATVRATQWARARWVDDFTTVLRADGASVRWHVAGLAVDGTGAALDRGAALRDRRLDAREDADLRQSGDRHR